jgi:hypothetical protein
VKHAIIPSLLLCACPGFDPLPVDQAGMSTGAGDPATGSTSVPWPTPPKWDVPQLDLGLAEPTTGTSTGEHVPGGSTGAPAPTIDLSVLRIGEVLADPDGKDGAAGSPEFVEIVHLGAADLPLAGLVIAARGWPELRMGDLGLAEQILQPGDLLVISRLATSADLPVPTVIREGSVLRAAFADGGGLRNDDGAVALFDEQGNPGDSILYGAPQPPPWDDPAQWSGSPVAAAADGNALCRPDVTVDTNTADDWTSCAPTPGELPPAADDTTGEPPLPATVAIVEVLANPPGATTLEKHAEFVELVNLGPGPVDLAGWTIADSLAPDAPGIDPLLYFGGDGGCQPATCLAPGGRALLVGAVYQGPVGDALVLKTDDGSLANAGLGNHEPVVLRDGDGELRTTYRAWPDPLSEPDPATMETAVVRASPESLDEPASWSFAAPTPGL